MKTILIKPNTKTKQYQQVKNLSAVEMPLWLSIIADAHEDSIIIDAEAENLNESELCSKIVTITLKEKVDKVVILATGSHPSAFIQQKEAMFKLEKLLSMLSLTVVTHETLPFNPSSNRPRYDLLPVSKYRAHNWHSWGYPSRKPYGAVYSSISCPFQCDFCTIKSFYNTPFQERHIEEVMYDFATMHNYGVTHIKMMDELFVFNQKRINQICDELIARDYKFNIWAYARIDTVNPQILEKLKKAGVNWLAYGIESGNDEIRKQITKGNFGKTKIRDVIQMTKDYGIHIVGNYMFGFWEDTMKTMQETFDFAVELNCEYSNFYCVVAYPESQLYNTMKEKGVPLPTSCSEYAQMSYEFNPLPTKHLDNKQVLKFRDEAFLKYFKNPSYLSSIGHTFGVEAVVDIVDMTDINIKRKLIE